MVYRQSAAQQVARLLVLAGLLASGPLQAQTIRDTVRQHVSEGLEGQPEDAQSPAQPKAKGKKDARQRRPSKRPPPGSVTPSADAPSQPPPADAVQSGPAPAAAEDALPKRMFGRNFQLDPKIGAGFRGWYPEQYPLVSIKHAGYFTWSLDLKAKLFGFLRLHRGYYESNGLKGPRTEGAVVARDVGKLVPKAAWLLGALGVPLSRRWETLVSYETRSFVTRARPSQPVAIVPRNTPADTDFATLTRSDQPLEFVSGFETLVLGVRYSPDAPAGGNSGVIGSNSGRFPPMYLGVGFTQYSKPYQVKVGNDALDELLFNGRFRGLGLAYGLSVPRHLARPYVDADAQLGLGQVQLLDDLTLNELLPEDWLIGYLQGNVTVGYAWPVLKTKPTPILTGELSGGGATFFYFKTKEGDSERPPALPLNWDFLWAVHVAFTLPL
ncbi:MAG: hypothetical protein ABI895_35820 [Deltaproteobacteria bacterium]